MCAITPERTDFLGTVTKNVVPEFTTDSHRIVLAPAHSQRSLAEASACDADSPSV
jgi:hypothetical protein